MAFPAALGAVGMASSAAGGIVGAIGSAFQGQAQAAQYKYQSGVAGMNAALAEQDARYTLTAKGEVEALQQGMKTRAEVGQTRAAFGAGNIDVGSGSARAVVGSETEIGQYNEALVRANAAKQAFGYNVQAAKDVAQAGAYDVAAQTAITAGKLGAVQSIVGGVASVSSKWTQAGQVGLATNYGDQLQDTLQDIQEG